MSNSIEKEKLNDYLSVYDKKVQDICLYLRRLVSEKQPSANQLIYDGFNAVSIVFSFSEKMQDAFCHLAVYKQHVNFGFNRGAEIKNPELELEGNGKLIRHHKVNDLNNVPEEELSALLDKAVELSLVNKPRLSRDMKKGKIIIKPTNGKKRRP